MTVKWCVIFLQKKKIEMLLTVVWFVVRVHARILKVLSEGVQLCFDETSVWATTYSKFVNFRDKTPAK